MNGPVTLSIIASHVPNDILYVVTIQSVNCRKYYDSLTVYHIPLIDVSVSNLVTVQLGQ